MTAEVDQTAYQPHIDGMRAIAVLAVVLFHLNLGPFGGGFVGVDIFFVISGFLITRLIMERHRASGRFSFSDFYVGRARRLFPALFATLSLVLVSSFLFLTPGQLRLVGLSTLSALFSVSNIFFWRQTNYFNPDSSFNPLLHTWSLSVEEQFYLIWPLTLVLLMRHAPRWVFGAIAASVLVSLATSEWLVRASDSAGFYLLPSRIFELGLGALTLWLMRFRGSHAWIHEVGALCGLALIAYAIVAISPADPFPGLRALVPCLGAMLLLHSGHAIRIGWVLRNRVATGIGAVSYSLYLVHWPIIVIYSLWKFDPLVEWERYSILAAALLLSIVFYHAIETPFRKHVGASFPGPLGRWRINAPNPTFVAASLLLAALLVIPSAAAWKANGWPDRFKHSNEIERLIASRGEKIMPSGPIGESPRFTVALIGDSHANRAYGGLMEWGERNGVRVDYFAAGDGCPPLYGIVVHGNPQQTTDCLARNDNMLEAIAHGHFDVVILVARWGLYTGVLTQPGAHHHFITLRGDDNQHRDFVTSRATFDAGLERTVNLMSVAGKQVLFVGQVPPIGVNPYPCIEKQASWKDVEYKCNATTYQQKRLETDWANKSAKSHGGSGKTFLVFDPYPVFCSSGQCRITEGGKMLYSDDSHLSLTGSRRLARALGPALVQIAGDMSARKAPVLNVRQQ